MPSRLVSQDNSPAPCSNAAVLSGQVHVCNLHKCKEAPTPSRPRIACALGFASKLRAFFDVGYEDCKLEVTAIQSRNIRLQLYLSSDDAVMMRTTRCARPGLDQTCSMSVSHDMTLAILIVRQ